MRLSTKGRYALQALVILGHIGDKDNNISLKSISLETEISEGYLEQLFRLLKSDSIIISKKGKNGGYQLAKPPSDIVVGEIFRAVEGSLSPVKCLDNQYCNRADICLTRGLWQNIYDEINDIVDNITLQSLIVDYDKAKKLEGTS